MQLLRILVPALIGIGVTVAASAPGHAMPTLSPDPWRLCPQAIAVQERTQAIPKHLLSAIAIAESGRKHPDIGRRMPWPWTVMAEGEGRYLPSKAAAISEVRQLQARGVRNIDVGCMQVNLLHHPDAFFSLDQAFEPDSNVAYAGQFLRTLFDSAGSWQEAAGMYHSATPEFKIPYRQRVLGIWNEQQRLEFAGNQVFGEGALTAGLDDARTAGARIRSPALMLSLADRRMNAAQGSRSARGLDLVNPLAPAAGARQGSAANGADLRSRDLRAPVRTLDQEAAFAIRRAQYLQELRRAVAEVKRTYAVQVARGGAAPGSADVE